MYVPASATPASARNSSALQKTLRQHGETQLAKAAQRRAEQIDAARVHPVGEAYQHRHGGERAGEIDAGDPAGGRVAQAPFGLHLGQQRRKRRNAQHAEHLGDAERENQDPVGHGRRPARVGAKRVRCGSAGRRPPAPPLAPPPTWSGGRGRCAAMSSAEAPNSIATTTSAIISPAPGPMMWAPSTRSVSASARIFTEAVGLGVGAAPAVGHEWELA